MIPTARHRGTATRALTARVGIHVARRWDALGALGGRKGHFRAKSCPTPKSADALAGRIGAILRAQRPARAAGTSPRVLGARLPRLQPVGKRASSAVGDLAQSRAISHSLALRTSREAAVEVATRRHRGVRHGPATPWTPATVGDGWESLGSRSRATSAPPSHDGRRFRHWKATHARRARPRAVAATEGDAVAQGHWFGPNATLNGLGGALRRARRPVIS